MCVVFILNLCMSLTVVDELFISSSEFGVFVENVLNESSSEVSDEE